MRRIGAIGLLISYCVMLLVLMAAPASAEIEGPCTASFNGIPFDDLDTPSEARERLVIQPGESVTLFATVPDTDSVYIDVLFPPLTITLAEFEEDEPSDQSSEIFEVEGEIELGDLATYGAGIFQFVGRTDDCRGNAYFVIGGVQPWETVVGKTAIGIAGVGILIGLTSWIPAIVAGGGGIVRSVIAGGPIGIGIAVLVQQTGLIPLSATSAGVAVVGSSIAGIFISKGLAGIHGVLSGGASAGGALPTPPPTSPPPPTTPATSTGSPPPVAETPMSPAQEAPIPSSSSVQGTQLTPQPPSAPGPEKVFVDDARLLGGEVTPVSGAELTPQPPSAPGSEKVFVDDARLLGGEATPVSGAELTPQPPEVPVQDAISTATPPGAPAGNPPPAADMPMPPPPATPPPTPQTPVPQAQPVPQSTTPPAPETPVPQAQPVPQSTTPPAPETLVPPAQPVPQSIPPQGGTPATTGAGTPASPPPAAVPPPSPGPAAPPTGTAPPPGAGGHGAGLAAGAVAAAGVTGIASRAAAAQKRAMSRSADAGVYRFSVAGPTDLYGLEDYGTVIGRLVPGNWYTARGTYDEWVHALDEASGHEGWVARHATIPFDDHNTTG